MRIRVANLSDVPAIARVYVDSWKTTYEGLMPELFLKGMTYESAQKIFLDSFQDQNHIYTLHVAETPEGRVIGFVDFGRERSHPESGMGEVYGIYLLQEFQRQGIGGKLFQVAVESLIRSGMNSIIVWVLEKSPYRAFYEKMGWKLLPGTRTLKVAGQVIQLVSYTKG